MRILHHTAGLAPDVASTLRCIGPRWATDIATHSQQVKELYAPLLAQAPKDGVTVLRDLAYGPHARQVLDLFCPKTALGAGVVVFVHGGAFVRGAKRVNDDLYDNVLYWFARQGLIGVNVEYRLAPEASYPQGALDVAAAMDWVQDHIGSYGGDASRVLLIGHSAGGTHAASYVFDPALECARRATALVLISARLRADQSNRNPNAAGVRAYFGNDASRYVQREPISFTACSATPTMVIIAQFENPLLDLYGLEFAHRLACARGQVPRFVQMPVHNHMSIIAHFNTEEETLGRDIMRFWSEA